MNQMTIKRTTSRARTPQQECHGKECAGGARNNYYVGKRLTPDSYAIEQRYAIDRRRLTNRAVHGCGVVYGYRLSTEDPGGHAGELQIGDGLAFDKLGRELIQSHATWFAVDNLLLLDGQGHLVRQDGRLNDRFAKMKGMDGCWLLSAHYAEKTIGHRTISDPCRCDREEWDRVCETVVYSLQPIDCGKCCTPWTCTLDCACPPATGCCSEHRRQLEDVDRHTTELIAAYEDKVASLDRQDAKSADQARRDFEQRLKTLADERMKVEAQTKVPRGGCGCLCDDEAKPAPKMLCDRMTDVDDCTTADLANGVPLACLKLAEDECETWAVGEIIDACGPRPLVKRNELLFDLINGCDLTTIIATGWAHWHRRSYPPVPFDDFSKALGWTSDTEDGEYKTRDFWVRFSRPVIAATLKPDVFVMAVMTDQGDDFWRRYIRVPIMSIETNSDADGLATEARIFVRTNWLRDAVMDRDHMFAQGRTRVEIEVRGDLIIDCMGQQVDANARGLAPYPSGNRTPGGTYLSTFTVARRVIREKAAPKPKANQPSQAQPAPAAQSDNRIR